MNKYLRLMFLAGITFLALIAGKIADRSVAYITRDLLWSNSFVMTFAVICLVLGAIMIFRLIGWRLDNIRTWFWLAIGSVLTGWGVGWAIGGVLLMMQHP